MINKIKKIRNLGIFSDFKWPDALENFKRFNLIYGWNGSGKTTTENCQMLCREDNRRKGKV